MVVDDQQEQHQEDADGGATAEGEQYGEDDEEAELAEDVGSGGCGGGHTDLIAAQGEAHGEPEEEEFAQEQGDALGAEVAFDGGDGGVSDVVHVFREFVQMEEDIAFFDNLHGVNYHMCGLFVLVFYLLDSGDVCVEGEFLFVLDGLEDGGDQGEEGVEDDECGQGGEVFVVFAVGVFPDHIAGAEKDMFEGLLRVFVQKGYAVEGAFVEVAGAVLEDAFFGGARFFPGVDTCLLPDGECAYPGCE